MGSATAITPITILRIKKDEIIRVLHVDHTFSDHFVSYMVSRNIRVEQDLIDQLFNSSEKRLARTLLLLAHYGRQDRPKRTIPGSLRRCWLEWLAQHAPSQCLHEQIQEAGIHQLQRNDYS